MNADLKTRHHRRRRHHDNSDMIAICLSDGPRTAAEIQEQFIALPRRFGVFMELIDRESIERGDLIQDLLATLERMEETGWVEQEGEQYTLTPLGQSKATERLENLNKAGELARRFLEPSRVSQVSLVVHLVLAAIKFPAGLLSGSVGLINDAADTLLDGLASLLVYAGLRLNKERSVNGVLVLLMLGTGGFTFYEAIRRFFIPVTPEVDVYAFLAAVLSGVVCLGLYFYQRYIGLKSGSVALITQSVDSRNHVIVAFSVTAGLVASILHFNLLDTLVGLVVAILILKSAVELGIETIRYLKEGDTDLSHYKMGILDRYDQFQQAQLQDWILFLVEKEKVNSPEELKTRVSQAFDFSDNPALRGFGLDQESENIERVEISLHSLIDRGLLDRNEGLNFTELGRERLVKVLKGTRGERHHLRIRRKK